MPPEIKAMVFFFMLKIPFCELAVADRYAADAVVTRSHDAYDRLKDASQQAARHLRP
jgi:hypothetical protein